MRDHSLNREDSPNIDVTSLPQHRFPEIVLHISLNLYYIYIKRDHSPNRDDSLNRDVTSLPQHRFPEICRDCTISLSKSVLYIYNIYILFIYILYVGMYIYNIYIYIYIIYILYVTGGVADDFTNIINK